MSDYSRMSREQLLAELAKKDDLMWERSVIDGKQIDAARAELATRDALLRKAREWLPPTSKVVRRSELGELKTSIDAVLKEIEG